MADPKGFPGPAEGRDAPGGDRKGKKALETKNAELYNLARIDQERAVLNETIAKNEAQLANARSTYERTQQLFKSGLIARTDAERDQTAYEVQQKELSEAKGQLDILEEQTDRNRDIKRKELAQSQSELNILLAGSRKESIRAMESQVNKLAEKLRILTQQMELLKIRSPIDRHGCNFLSPQSHWRFSGQGGHILRNRQQRDHGDGNACSGE